MCDRGYDDNPTNLVKSASASKTVYLKVDKRRPLLNVWLCTMISRSFLLICQRNGESRTIVGVVALPKQIWVALLHTTCVLCLNPIDMEGTLILLTAINKSQWLQSISRNCLPVRRASSLSELLTYQALLPFGQGPTCLGLVAFKPIEILTSH